MGSNSDSAKLDIHGCLFAQSCPTLCDSMDYRPPGSSVYGILPARILDWLPFPSPGHLPHPEIELMFPASQADSLPLSHQGQFTLSMPQDCSWGFSSGSVVKNLPANAGETGDASLIPGSGRYPGEGNSNRLEYS